MQPAVTPGLTVDLSAHSSGTHPQRRISASNLLSKFLPGAHTKHKMDRGGKENKSPYEITIIPSPSKNNHNAQILKGPGGPRSSHAVTDNTAMNLPAEAKDIDEDDDNPQTAITVVPSRKASMGFDAKDKNEDEDIAIKYTTPRRQTRSGLRNCKLKEARESHGNISKGLHTPSGKKQGARIKQSSVDKSPVLSNRVAIRREIGNTTAVRRHQFLTEHKDYWLPLLPPKNYVQKLVDNHARLSPAELNSFPTVVPYQEIDKQPDGIEAVMKPYQLSGLSFLVYLHKNGLSGILGDEMGLGKTLQTLALCQYLKEHSPSIESGRSQRPFLIVCPLSVLSSWSAEAKKWTPGLKAIRFHGAVQERQRLKRIIGGEIDAHGNLTQQARSKMRSRSIARGKELMNLESSPDDEDDVSVNLVVTTYDCFKAEQDWFKRVFVWRYVVLDEGHTIKKYSSLISQSLQGLNAEYRLILTGTPLQNNLSELWSLLHWLYPEVFVNQTSELFEESFNLSKGKYSNAVLDHSRRLLELIMLRRMKNSPGVELNLPSKTEVLLFVPLSPMQKFWYTRMITKADKGLLDGLFRGAKEKEVRSMESAKDVREREMELLKAEQDALNILDNNTLIGNRAWMETKSILEQTIQREQDAQVGRTEKTSDWQKLMNLLMQLRKVSNHPYCISQAEPTPYHTGEHVIAASGKLIILEKLVYELVVKQKKKILIFSGFTMMLDLVEELLHLRGGNGESFLFSRIDGSTSRARRNLAIRMFNDLSSDYRVMLISTRAGGLGINLATASDVVFLDQDWNPQIMLQAEARAHRIGQRNPVTVYKLVSQGTVEEQMMGRIQKKLYLSTKVTESMQDIHTKFGSGNKSRKGTSSSIDDDMPNLTTNQLMTLVRRGASAISQPEIDINEMISWDWDTIVDKCKDNPADINVTKDAIPDATVDKDAERKWLTEIERVEASIFEGKKMAKTVKHFMNHDVANEVLSRQDRRAGKNTTVMVDGYAISKESMGCGDWEAVPTLAGKDPSLAEPVRAKKAPIEPQSHCQVCLDGGELHICNLCPRAYHLECLDTEYQAKAKRWQFNCPQHRCFDCQQNTQDAGGMLYRCRWCEHAYCEDCLDFEKTTLIGDNLMEYELLDYPEMTQAFYIQCGACTENFIEMPQNKKMCDDLAEEIRREHESRFHHHETSRVSTRAPSLTDATTVSETSGVATPALVKEEYDDEEQKKAVEYTLAATSPAIKRKLSKVVDHMDSLDTVSSRKKTRRSRS